MEFWIALWNIISTFIIGNIVAIIAVLVSLILFILSTKSKGFSYYIESANSVVRVEENVSDKVEVLYEGSKVENVNLIVVTIRNSGNLSIEKEDFTRPVLFGFGWDAKVLSVSVVETEPPSFDPSFLLNDNTVELVPILLNGGDNFIVNFLVSDWDPDAFEVHGRIVGVKDIKLEKGVSGFTKLFLILAAIVLVPAVLLMNFQVITLLQGSQLIMFSYILLVMSILTTKKGRARVREYILTLLGLKVLLRPRKISEQDP